jgi:hypothetical protein
VREGERERERKKEKERESLLNKSLLGMKQCNKALCNVRSSVVKRRIG